MEEVWAAADAVLSLGERPTIERVRQHLGRGSPNTVGPMLDGWYGSLAKRLHQHAADDERDASGAALLLPAAVARAAKTMWGRALQHAEDQAAANLVESREELEVQAVALREARDHLAKETQRQVDRSAAYELAMQVKDAQIADLGRSIEDLKQQLLSSQQGIDTLRTEYVQLRRVADADRRSREARELEHQTERSRLEDRAQAQERRLNGEVDRARQEAKRLSVLMESDQKRATKSLADATDRAREFETKIGALLLDKAGLSQDLQSALEQIKGLQARLDGRSNDMFAVLHELRDRLPPNLTEESTPPVKVRKSKIKR
ncbi:DNA-binding protein [Acidovorax sp. NCPPB 3576]|uniref:DNA-binding protein n=1 Tax=Acidovorax sp. NCPPB 3576 TaxID=2940488 RepID=UPI002349BF02|nr:DNA-binding protein [Acidovorax sp. NCPPB 3576]WCM90510.1 DNA-binding protein [Acidovorax sp. NCPPB 3576]